MKTFLKIFAAIIGIFILVLIALNIYFNDDRLREMIVPGIQEASGADIQIERLSLTFFRTFPKFGVEAENLFVPDEAGDSLFSSGQLLVSVDLFPLLRNELSISRLELVRPVINYTVRPDSTTNIDFLLSEEEPGTTAEQGGYDVSISGFTLTDGAAIYSDSLNNSRISLSGLNAGISLRFADNIESQVNAELESLSVTLNDVSYFENLSLRLDQTSIIDTENETLTFSEGFLGIRGLDLNMTGTVSSWSSDTPIVDLQFTSSSEDFGDLLQLVPPEYTELVSGYESSGSLRLEGSFSGPVGGEELPEFQLEAGVEDGYLKNPDLPEAIRDIALDMSINNQEAVVREFRAAAGDNQINASGSLSRPLEDDAGFSVAFNGNIDLATVTGFINITELGIDELSGVFRADAETQGRLDDLENATLTGRLALENGRFKYTDVPQAIEQISIRAEANGQSLTFAESGFRTTSGDFTFSGEVNRPLDTNNRTVNLTAGMNFDLSTIKDFYPIDEDTLSMRGTLIANVQLQGNPDSDQLESLVRQGRAELSNGYLSHRSIAKPLEEITFLLEAAGPALSVRRGNIVSGQNSLSVSGSVTDYLSEQPVFNLTFNGNAVLADITNYYSLEPWIQRLNGTAVMQLAASGPAGDPRDISLNGSMEVRNVYAAGDSLGLPISGLNGLLTIRPASMTLENFEMNYGSTDIALQGSLDRYLGFLEESHESEATMPQVSGSFRSTHLNMDEMIDWEEDADESIPIELPDMLAAVDANIDTLTVFGLNVTEIGGSGTMNPEQILLEESRARLFGGTATGSMDWQVPDPLRTNVRFSGRLDTLRAADFFRETGFLGRDRNLHNHVSGALNVSVDYYAELDDQVSPDITTTVADGSFGMTRSSLEGHPIQVKIAEFVRDPRLERVNLDEWEADFAIRDTVLTLSDLTLTSDSIGIQMNGTQHLMTNRIDYVATLLLPASFKRVIATVISAPAADALQQENGTMGIPIRITGTTQTPVIRPDTRVIEEIIRERATEGGRDILRRLFNRNGSDSRDR
jgi:hypothetical protein